MPHIHTEDAQHDITASGLIVYVGESEPKILLHMHKNEQKLLQPGGHVELNENPWQAIRHELVEETGFELRQLELLLPVDRLRIWDEQHVLHPIPMLLNTHLVNNGSNLKHYHTDIAWAFITNELPTGKPGEGESQDLRWLTKFDIAELSDDEISGGIREATSYVFDVCIPKWERVALGDFAS